MPDIRRDLLVKSAFAQLSANGFEGLRLRDVAADAGIDHSTIHHYFRTKEDLIAAAVDYSTGLFRVSLAPDGPACVRMSDHFRSIARLIAAEPALFIVMNEIRQHALRHEATRTALDAQDRGWFMAVTGLVADGIAEGCWSVEPATTASLIMAVMQGVNLSPGGAENVLRQLESLLVGTATAAPPGHVHGDMGTTRREGEAR